MTPAEAFCINLAAIIDLPRVRAATAKVQAFLEMLEPVVAESRRVQAEYAARRPR